MCNVARIICAQTSQKSSFGCASHVVIGHEFAGQVIFYHLMKNISVTPVPKARMCRGAVMLQDMFTSGPKSARLRAEEYAGNFEDLHPRLDIHQAAFATDRCYFCHDAPCIVACPPDIDNRLFVGQIATVTPDAAAKMILRRNILGVACPRVSVPQKHCAKRPAHAKWLRANLF